MIKKIALLLVFFGLAFPLIGQQTTVYTEAYESYKKGQSLFEKGVFGKAQREFQKTINLLRPTNEAESELLRTKAELHYARCAVQLDLPDGEKLVLDFIRKHAPDPISNEALIELANFYFNSRKYDKAIEYYAKVPTGGLSKEVRTEMRFRLGYALFVKKEFDKAKSNFKLIQKDQKSDYFHPANYYLGLCNFFQGDYPAAIKNFRVAEKDKKYKSHIPYYICQIYFAERQFEDLIAYATPKINDRSIRKTSEMHQLIGQSYFELGEYENALYYLEYYADRTSKLREEEFYQLGYTQYQTGNYTKAIQNFEQLSDVESALGQNAMYALGDSYLKIGKKSSAQTAFATARRMNYDQVIKEEANFNYAKLAYELGSPREAISALQSIEPSSRYYPDAQTIMSEIFVNYRDYKQAIEIIEQLPDKTPQIRESYQKVTFYRGLQLLQNGDENAAIDHFNKSLDFPIDIETKALAIYWLADMAHRNKQYNKSIRQMNQFLTLAKTLTTLPDESSIFTGNYIMGYNYLKQENFPSAYTYFKETVDGIKRNRSFIRSSKLKNEVLGDAIMRAGDCLFKRNNYRDAVALYDEAIDRRYTGYVYAIYQKAIIEGLRGRQTDKIIALERIPNEFPNSEYADDALLQLGTTYQEIGQFNKAKQPLLTLVRDYKNKSDLINKGLIKLGLISYNQGNLEQAINYYKQVFTNNPTAEEGDDALAALEEIYIDDLGRPDDYFAFLETIPGYKVENSTRDSINYQAAESQFENGNYTRAIEGYTNYIRKFPNGKNALQAHYNRGESYSVLKQYSNALLDYEYVINKGQSAFYLKALEKAAIIAYNHEQDFNKSYDLYARLENAATNEDMRFEAQLGGLRSAYRNGNSRAVYELASKVSNHPRATTLQIATANFYTGKMAFDQKDYDNALAAFNKVIQFSDNEQTAEARYLTAYIYYLRRDLERAQEITINANKESSGYPYWVANSIILLSDILAEKGDLYNARAALEALLENYNEDQDLINIARSKLDQINRQINQASRLTSDPDPNTLELDNGNQ
jgi:tetratricopeptide (TPR) repeat protein